MNTPFRTSGRTVEILMVEDNPTDVRLLKEALHHSHFAMNIVVADDGEKALSYLHQQGSFPEALQLDLVLLDLLLPKKNGWEVLEEVKKDPALGHLPIVILTGSKDVGDTQHARDLKADLFVLKPRDLKHFPILVNSIEHLLVSRPHWQASHS